MAAKKGQIKPPNTHKKTKATINIVKNSVLAGLPEEIISKVVGISRKTLRKHYKEELATAKANVAAKVTGMLAQKAMQGDNTCMIFYLKTQCGWRETSRHEHSGEIKTGEGPSVEVRIIAPEVELDG